MYDQYGFDEEDINPEVVQAFMNHDPFDELKAKEGVFY